MLEGEVSRNKDSMRRMWRLRWVDSFEEALNPFSQSMTQMYYRYMGLFNPFMCLYLCITTSQLDCHRRY